jgi:hypothetical protein
MKKMVCATFWAIFSQTNLVTLLGIDNVVICLTIWNILRPFGTIYGRLV